MSRQNSQQRYCCRGALALLGGTIVLFTGLLLGGTLDTAQVTAEDAASWEPTGLHAPIQRLFTPASGSLFARTSEALFRSDDAGATWAAVPLPPLRPPTASEPAPLRTTPLLVAPTDHRVLYVQGAAGLYKSADDAATWQMLPLRLSPAETATLAVSPADPAIVYLALTTQTPAFRFLRSRDGGLTWEELAASQAGSGCVWSMELLTPHPTDPERVFRTAGCRSGRSSGGVLEQSTDQGTTWSALLRLVLQPPCTNPGTLQPLPNCTPGPAAAPAYPEQEVGGQGTAPERFYVAANRDPRFGGSAVYRSDDDGQSWTEALAFRGGGSLESTRNPDAPNIQIGGLAYEPGSPDHVYVGLSSVCASPSRTGCDQASHVLASADGGQTWTDSNLYGHGQIHDLAVGIDSRNIYAATDQGVWSLRLP
jgi:photosystem II stability/assembly factor-like uncharacterized protein